MKLFKSSILVLSLTFSFLNASKSDAVKIFVENQESVIYAPINDISNTIRTYNVGKDIEIDENTLQQGQYILKIPQGNGSEREIGFLVINDLLPGRAMQIYMNNDGFVTLYFNGNTDHYAVQAVSKSHETKIIKNLAGKSATFHNDQFDTELLILKGAESIHIPLFPELNTREINIIEIEEEQLVENKADNTLISQQIAELFYEINQTLKSSPELNEDVMQYAEPILNIEQIYYVNLEKLLLEFTNFLSSIDFFNDHEVVYNWLANTDESKTLLASIETAFELSLNRKQYNQNNDYDYMIYVTSVIKACCDRLNADDARALKTDLIQHLNELGNRGAHIGSVARAHMFLVLANSLQYMAKILAA